jgi:hypothetical protein
MKKIFLCLLTTALFFSACEKKNDCEKINTTPIIGSQQAILENTKWKLVGFVDVAKGCLKRVEPTKDCGKYYNCEKFYTLHFTDSILYGYTTMNGFNAIPNIDYTTNSIQIKIILTTEAGEMGDGYLYCDVLDEVQSFALQNNELRLFYNNKKNYLLFKARQS